MDAELFHTGVIVDDLDKAMADLSAAFGYEFATPLTSPGTVHTPCGVLFKESRITFSLGDGPHRLELIEQIDNTAWRTATGGPKVHHLGYWVDDLAAQVRKMEELGYVREFFNEGEDGEVVDFSYLLDPHSGLFIEVVDIRMRPGIESLWKR